MSMRRGTQKGWVLVDALMALTFLAVALLALALAYRQTVLGTITVDQRTKAAYLAQQQLSELRRYEHQGYDRSDTRWQRTLTTDAGSQLQYEYAVVPAEEIPAGLDSNIIPVQVTVQWPETAGWQSFTVVTYYYR